MTSKPSFTERAAATKAATAAKRDAWQALTERYLILNGDTDTDPDQSAAAIRRQWLNGEASALDAMTAQYELDQLPTEIERLRLQVRDLASRELTTDTSLALAISAAVADALGGVPVEVVHELPERFSAAPRAYLVQKGEAERDPFGGHLSGKVQLHYLRATSHQTPKLDPETLGRLLGEQAVHLTRTPLARSTSGVGSGLLLDAADLEVRYVMPDRVSFPAWHRPDQQQARSLADDLARDAAASLSVPDWTQQATAGQLARRIGRHQADNVSFSVSESDGLRRVVVRASLAITGKPSEARDALGRALQESVGRAAAGLGRIVTAREASTVGLIQNGNQTGYEIIAEITCESVVIGSDAAQAA